MTESHSHDIQYMQLHAAERYFT